MNDTTVLEDLIGRVLCDGLIQSFELRGSLISQINVSFLKFNNWIRIVTSEGETTVSMEMRQIQSISELGDDEFKYPLTKLEDKFPEFKKYLGKRLIGFKELVFENNPALSFGLNLYFENDLNLIIFNTDYSTDDNEFIFFNRIPDHLKEK
jgi:hypothetical protein